MTDYVKGIQNHTHLNKKWVQQRIREVLKPRKTEGDYCPR